MGGLGKKKALSTAGVEAVERSCFAEVPDGAC